MHNIGFADVENGKTEAIRWSAANEIVTGYGSGKFGPEAVLTHSLGGYAPIDNFGITELVFDNQKRMLYFTADRRFSVFDFLAQVDAFIFLADFKVGWSDVGPELNVFEAFIILDVITFLRTTISGIAITDFIIFPKQFCRFFYIMYICGSSCNGMDISASGINARMNFHAVIPLIAFLRLMHLWIALAVYVLCGTWCRYDGCIND